MVFEPTEVTDTLSEALGELDIEHSIHMGTIEAMDGRLYVKAQHIARSERNVWIRFDIFASGDAKRMLTPTSTIIQGITDAEPSPVHYACREWIEGCFVPLTRAVTPNSGHDQYFNLYVSGEDQVLFDAHSGPLLKWGENSESWDKRFIASLFDWVIANSRLQFPNRRFNVVRFGMRTNGNDDWGGMSLLNGSRWPEADVIMKELEWPGTGPQSLQAYVVLRRVIQVPAELKWEDYDD